jgi:hypothetical protein
MAKFCVLICLVFVAVMSPQRVGAESGFVAKPLATTASRADRTPLTRLAYCAYQGGSCSSDADCCAGACSSQHKCSK